MPCNTASALAEQFGEVHAIASDRFGTRESFGKRIEVPEPAGLTDRGVVDVARSAADPSDVEVE